MHDVERIVSLVYEEASCSEVRPPGPVALLRQMVGADAIAFVDDRNRVTGLPHAPRVRIRRGLHGEALCMAFAHAAAVVAFAMHCPGETLCEERIAPLTAALVMPAPAFRAAVRMVGPRAEALGSIFVVPATVVRQRLVQLGIALRSGQYLRVVQMKTAG